MLALTRQALRLACTALGPTHAQLASCRLRAARPLCVTVMSSKKNFYAVVRGKKPGLYTSWEECSAQVTGFPGNKYKSFTYAEDAAEYMAANGMAEAAAHSVPALPAAPAARRSVQPSTRTPRRVKPLVLQAAAAAAQGPRHSGGVAADTAETGGAAPQRNPRDRTIRLEFDGASKRNPGPAGFGAVLYDELTGTEVTRLCQYMGASHTNNQAEYAGLIAGLQAALELGCSHIKVQGDSNLIIKQVLGEWQVKNEGLMPYHAAARELMQRFSSFSARQVPREQNKVADALSNEAITNYTSGINPHIWKLGRGQKRRAAAAAAAEEQEGGAEGGTAAAAAAAAEAGEEEGGSSSIKRKRRRKVAATADSVAASSGSGGAAAVGGSEAAGAE